MEQFNNNTYKKRTVVGEFTHSCLGKIVILAAVMLVLFFIAIFTRPTDNMMMWQMEDNIHECLQASDSIQSDAIDDYVENIGRVFTHADTTQTNPELLETYRRLNRLTLYEHSFFKTAHIVNNVHPEGVRVGVGIFGIVFPTIKFTDLLMNTGAVRGDYGKRLIRDINVPDNYMGDNPNVQPYHYKGNPDD